MFDVDSMIQAADLEAMMAELGIDTDRRKNKRGHELYFNCINPKHDDDEKKMSMAESGQYKGLFYCWSCKLRGNIIQVIQHFLSATFHESLRWMEDRTGVGTLMGTESLIYQLKKEKLNYGVTTQPEDIPTYERPEDFTPCGCGSRRTEDAERFLTSRKITQGTWRKFGVGVSSYRGLGDVVTIPIYFYDERIASIFYAQPWTGGLKRYPKGSPQGRILFNYDECVKVGRYTLVESILDVLTIDSLNLGPAMACFTNMLSEDQIKLLKVFDKHAVFPDRDSPNGWLLVNRMVSGLDKSVQLILPPLGKDPGDCESWEMVDSFANRISYADWEVECFMSDAAPETGKVNSLKKR